VKGFLLDLVLPRTDAGVHFQTVVAVVVFSAALWWTRRNRDLLTFVAGLATITFAWFALRTVH
jgi:hypothetical protein